MTNAGDHGPSQRDPPRREAGVLAGTTPYAARRACASLIELNAERPHDVTPAFDLVGIEFREFVARRRARFESERLDPGRKAGGLHDLHQLAAEPVENRLRRSRRGVEAGPERTDEL